MLHHHAIISAWSRQVFFHLLTFHVFQNRSTTTFHDTNEVLLMLMLLLTLAVSFHC
jgi:hypothetical protein